MNELVNITENNMTIWEEEKSLAEIKNLFAANLTPVEFKVFIGLGKATGLSPFLREIWAVKYPPDKYGNARPAQIFIGRDGYRKSAQRNPQYDYHQVDAVYTNDEFKVCNGEIIHSYNLADRGKLAGAYCIAKRQNSSRPSHVYVSLEEYDKQQSCWKTLPATMIKKVAEAQALRLAFQEIFAGTYHEYEFERPEHKLLTKTDGMTQTERVKASYKARTESITGELINDDESSEAQTVPDVKETPKKDFEVDSGVVITDETLDLISSLIQERGLDEARINSLLSYFEVEKLKDMTEFKGKKCAVFLERLPVKQEEV